MPRRWSSANSAARSTVASPVTMTSACSLMTSTLSRGAARETATMRLPVPFRSISASGGVLPVLSTTMRMGWSSFPAALRPARSSGDLTVREGSSASTVPIPTMMASLSALIRSTRAKSSVPEIFTCRRSLVDIFPSALMAMLMKTNGRICYCLHDDLHISPLQGHGAICGHPSPDSAERDCSAFIWGRRGG